MAGHDQERHFGMFALRLFVELKVIKAEDIERGSEYARSVDDFFGLDTFLRLEEDFFGLRRRTLD